MTITGISTAATIVRTNSPMCSGWLESQMCIRDRFHYTPNWFARGLNLGRTNTVALLVPTFEHGIYHRVVTGVETVAAKKGAGVLLCNTHGTAEGEVDSLRMVLDRKVDGVILGAARLSAAQLDATGLRERPFEMCIRDSFPYIPR